jgi:hypothetical protein
MQCDLPFGQVALAFVKDNVRLQRELSTIASALRQHA